MCFGPPFSRRARTRSTRTTNPAYRSRCSNLRCSHADQTARTPPVLSARAQLPAPHRYRAARSSPTVNASGPLSTSSSTASKRLRLACSISATSAISTVTRCRAAARRQAARAARDSIRQPPVRARRRALLLRGRQVERCPQREAHAEPANQNRRLRRVQTGGRQARERLLGTVHPARHQAPAVRHDHVFAIVAGEGQRGPVRGFGPRRAVPRASNVMHLGRGNQFRQGASTSRSAPRGRERILASCRLLFHREDLAILLELLGDDVDVAAGRACLVPDRSSTWPGASLPNRTSPRWH